MSAGRDNVCVCVAGWHFPEDFFRSLHGARGIEVYVVSHQPRACVPAHVFETVPADRLLMAPNTGYDWGCFQQFLDTGRWRAFDAVAFIHDDVQILDPGVFAAGVEQLKRHAVVANGRIEAPRAWTDTHPESYIHASWIPPRGYVHDVVRGSFFMATRSVLERIGFLDVFWDRYNVTSFFGNWSTRASCARWQHLFGPDCFGFLSQSGCISDFLVEHIRGVDARTHEEMRQVTTAYALGQDAWRRWLWSRSVRWSARYMRRLWETDATGAARPALSAGAGLVRHMAGRPRGGIGSWAS